MSRMKCRLNNSLFTAAESMGGVGGAVGGEEEGVSVFSGVDTSCFKILESGSMSVL